MAEQLSRWSDWDHLRFACDCASPMHVLDVCVEHDEEATPLLSFTVYMNRNQPLPSRFLEAIRHIRGKEVCCEGVIIRPEDFPELIKVVSSVVLNLNTDGT